MHASLLLVVRQFAVSVGMLVPVIPVAFVSMPMNLGGHPGEPPDSSAAVARHMTRCAPLDRAQRKCPIARDRAATLGANALAAPSDLRLFDDQSRGRASDPRQVSPFSTGRESA